MHLDVVLPMYREIWAEPPYCEGPEEIAEFLDRFAHEVLGDGEPHSTQVLIGISSNA